MRGVLISLLGLLLLVSCDDDSSKPDAPDSVTVIEELGGMQRDLDDFDVCEAVKDIPDLMQRAEALLGEEVVSIEPNDKLKNSGQTCAFVTESSNLDGAMTIGAAQGPDIANAISPKDERLMAKCFVSHKQSAGVHVRCRPSLSLGVYVKAGEGCSPPESRAECIDLVADLLASLAKQG